MLNTIFGVIGWLGTLLVFAGVAIRLFRPQWDQYAYWAAVGGLVCVLLYTLSQWREIGRSFSKRQTRFTAMTALSVISVLVILIGVNYLVDRRGKRWDLTSSKSFTLSDQTMKVLNNLKASVNVYVVDKPDGFQRFRDALGGYEFASTNVHIEYLDPDRNRAKAQELGIVNYGTVVFEHDGRRERVMSDREQELTNALIKVTTGRQIKAYFVQGHGEKDSTGVDRNGYSSALDVLKRDNYTVDKIALAQTPDVPADASVLIIAGPTSDYLPSEIDAMRKYLRRGGKALILLDPLMGTTMRPVPNLEGLLKESGITMGHDVVLDVSGVSQDATIPVVTSYPDHPITKDFSTFTAFPLAQSVSGLADMNLGPSANTQDLIKTSERSWSESEVKSLATGGKVSLDEKAGDHKGPITIGLTLSMDAPDAPASAAAAAPASASTDKPAPKPDEAPPKPQTRIVVLGDSDFATNAVAGVPGNSDLFVNVNNWLTQQEDLISIHPRAEDDRRISLTADQQRRIVWLSLLLIPGLILGSGVYTWWQRR